MTREALLSFFPQPADVRELARLERAAFRRAQREQRQRVLREMPDEPRDEDEPREDFADED